MLQKSPPIEAECLVYTVPEAGAMIGLTKNGSYEAAKRGDIPTIRIGRLYKVPKAAFHAMIDAAGQKVAGQKQ
jgi:excisionase family DNA binding protein